MLNSIYSLSDGIALNAGELEAEGYGVPMSSSPLKSSTKQEDLYEAFTYGFHSSTDYDEKPMNVGIEAYGYSPYGIASE
jgi:hypothetical protein